MVDNCPSVVPSFTFGKETISFMMNTWNMLQSKRYNGTLASLHVLFERTQKNVFKRFFSFLFKLSQWE